MTKSLYDKLGVTRDATKEEISKAYKDKAKELHPDKGGDGKEMAEVNNAYLVLKDDVKRKRYDDTGQEDRMPFDRRFAEFVNMIFMKLVDISHDVESVDLVKDFSVQVGLQIKEIEKGKKGLVAKLSKCEKVLKRLADSKDKRIGMVVENNISALKQQIKITEEEIKFLKDCDEIINHHSYKVDEKEEEENFWSYKSINYR